MKVKKMKKMLKAAKKAGYEVNFEGNKNSYGLDNIPDKWNDRKVSSFNFGEKSITIGVKKEKKISDFSSGDDSLKTIKNKLKGLNDNEEDHKELGKNAQNSNQNNKLSEKRSYTDRKRLEEAKPQNQEEKSTKEKENRSQDNGKRSRLQQNQRRPKVETVIRDNTEQSKDKVTTSEEKGFEDKEGDKS